MELLCDWVLGRITSLCHANLKLFSPSGHKHKHVHMHSHTCSEIIRIKLNRQFTSTVLKKKNTLIYDLKIMRMLLNGGVPAVQSCYFIFILFASVKRKKKKKKTLCFLDRSHTRCLTCCLIDANTLWMWIYTVSLPDTLRELYASITASYVSDATNKNKLHDEMLSCLTQNPDRIFILCIDVSSITNKSTEKKVLEICVNYYVPECKTL